MREHTEYLAWIADHVNQETGGYGDCQSVTEAMVEAFPELEVRKGFFYCMSWGRRTHWWLRRGEDGLIVDPTGMQHPTGTLLAMPGSQDRYDDLTDKTEEELMDLVPSGPCMNCGEPVYRGETFCCKACEHEVMANMQLLDNGNWRNIG